MYASRRGRAARSSCVNCPEASRGREVEGSLQLLILGWGAEKLIEEVCDRGDSGVGATSDDLPTIGLEGANGEVAS